MKFLITGGKGQLGSEFAHLESSQLEMVRLGSKELDITNAHAIRAALDHHKPDALINCAAYTAVDKAETEQEAAYAINRDAVAHLAAACSDTGIPIVHVSTDYVFSGDKTEPYVESDATGPQGVYGASKLAGEIELQSHCANHCIVRVSWVFGQYGGNFVKTMLRLASDRPELSVVGDQFGGPTPAAQIAERLRDIAESMAKGDSRYIGTFHLESQPHCSWHEFAHAIFDEAVKQNRLESAPTLHAISTEQYPTPARRPSNSRLTSEKNLQALPSCNWQLGLEHMLKAL